MNVNPTTATTLKKDELIVITGAGGFIAGSLVKYFSDQGFTHISSLAVILQTSNVEESDCLVGNPFR